VLLKLRLGREEALIYVSKLNSPKTYRALLSTLPLQLRVRSEGGLLVGELNLRVAPEGHRTTLCTGQVAYWTPASALVIALWEGCRSLPSPVNYLGCVVRGLDALRRVEGVALAELRAAEGEDVQGPLIDA